MSEKKQLLAKDVENYLKDNPNFFMSHETLLTELNFNHGKDHALALFREQMANIRKENIQLVRQIEQLIDNSKQSDNLLQRIKQVIVVAIKQTSVADLEEAVRQQIDYVFGLKFCALFLTDDVKAKLFLPLLANKSSQLPIFCGCLSDEEKQLLQKNYNNLQQNLGYLESVSIMRLGNVGFCMIGSNDNKHFTQSLKLTYLSLLGEVLTALLARLQS